MTEKVSSITGDVEGVRRLLDLLHRDGGGGGNSGDMERRLSRLESQYDTLAKDMSEVKSDVKSIQSTLTARPSLTEWQVARVVAAVMAFFMAAAIFAPRLLAMLPQ